jgi:hypothetical protein
MGGDSYGPYHLARLHSSCEPQSESWFSLVATYDNILSSHGTHSFRRRLFIRALD